MIREISDKTKIREFLTRDPFLHIYELGDLDDFFWPHTRWYAWEEDSEIVSLFMLYRADPSCPSLLAFEEESLDSSRALMKELIRIIPTPSMAHISLHLNELIEESFETTSKSIVEKMSLRSRALERVTCILPKPIELGPADGEEVQKFYEEAYPDNWFDPRMLATEYYLGARLDDRLVSIAGIHVYSSIYRAAALGNIATHPDYRGRGLATHLTFHLCRKLFRTVDYIGLNVLKENRAAIKCYLKLGFRSHSRFAVTKLQRRR